jgi:hypothetical protein
MSKTKSVLVLLCVVLSAATYAQRAKLTSAGQDPFAGYAPVPKAAKPKMRVIAPPLAPMAAALPTAPELGLQYAGQMTTPSGERQVFAMQQDQLMTLRVGAVLANGYVVQSVESKVVRFLYPALNTTARLNLPDAPRFESR